MTTQPPDPGSAPAPRAVERCQGSDVAAWLLILADFERAAVRTR